MKRKHFNEKGEEPQFLFIDLAKKDFARSKIGNFFMNFNVNLHTKNITF